MRQYLSVLLTVVFFAVAGTGARAQYISEFAGTPDNTGITGDGGPATAAFLFSPSDIALDAIGNLYITDFINNVIRRVDTFGIIHTIAGTGLGAGSTGGTGGGYTGDGGPATAADLNGPFGVVVDPAGNVIFADGYNHVVRRISTTGIITTIAGNNTAGYSGDGGPATAAALNNPVGVALDKMGNLYIGDDHNNAVRKVGSDGVITTFAGNHTTGYSGNGGPATAAALNTPIGVGVDTAGNVYIADGGNNVIRKVNTADIITTFAGDTTSGYNGDGGPATAAQLRNPERVNPDDSGNVYISDFLNNVVRKVNAAGVITTYAGIGTGASSTGTMGAFSGDGGLASAAELFLPSGVAISRKGIVYICDRANEVVRKVGPQDRTGIHAVNIAGAGKLTTYPNPVVAGNFMLSLTTGTSEPAEITITDVLGKTIKQLSIVTNKPVCVSIDALPGVYLLSAKAASGAWNKQIVVR